MGVLEALLVKFTLTLFFLSRWARERWIAADMVSPVKQLGWKA